MEDLARHKNVKRCLKNPAHASLYLLVLGHNPLTTPNPGKGGYTSFIRHVSTVLLSCSASLEVVTEDPDRAPASFGACYRVIVQP